MFQKITKRSMGFSFRTRLPSIAALLVPRLEAEASRSYEIRSREARSRIPTPPLLLGEYLIRRRVRTELSSKREPPLVAIGTREKSPGQHPGGIPASPRKSRVSPRLESSPSERKVAVDVPDYSRMSIGLAAWGSHGHALLYDDRHSRLVVETHRTIRAGGVRSRLPVTSGVGLIKQLPNGSLGVLFGGKATAAGHEKSSNSPPYELAT